MSEMWTPLNILILSEENDCLRVAELLSGTGANVKCFKIHDENRGLTDNLGVEYLHSWRTELDFPDLVIYDDTVLYNKWVRATKDKKGVPVLYLDTGIEKRTVQRAVQELPVTVLASILSEVSEPSTIRWWQFWRRGNRSA